MQTRKHLITPLLIASFVGVSVIGGPVQAASKDYSPAIRLAVDRWLAVQKPSGFLPYGFDFLADEESEPESLSKENLARQAGTAAALADYYALTKDSRARPALEKFLTAFGRHSLPIGKGLPQRLIEQTRLLPLLTGRKRIGSALNRLGLLYTKQGPGKVLSPDADYSLAYTGTVALALLTELRYAQTSADARFADLRQAWLQALLDLRIPGGGFRSYPTTINPRPYSDGQAWLVLAEYHRLFPQDERVAEMLATVDDRLIKTYSSDFKIDFYHWGAMAAAARYVDSKDVKFLDFIKYLTSAFLDRRQQLEKYNDCASVEGLADTLAALAGEGEGEGELANQVRRWVAREMTKTDKLQIRPGQKELTFANARVEAPRLQEYAGSFLAGSYGLSTQVDYTSHCVSAMIKLQRQNRLAGKR
jgi:hypothetical protein